MNNNNNHMGLQNMNQQQNNQGPHSNFAQMGMQQMNQ